MSSNGPPEPIGAAPPTTAPPHPSPFASNASFPSSAAPLPPTAATPLKPVSNSGWEAAGRGAQDANIKYRFRSVNFDIDQAANNPRTRKYVEELQKLHPGNDGMITQDQFLEFLDDYVNKKVRVKWMNRVVAALVLYALFITLATTGLVWAVVALTKDTKTSNTVEQYYFVDKSTGNPLATAYTRVATNVSYLDEQTLINTYGLDPATSASLNPTLNVLPQELATVRMTYYTSFPQDKALAYCHGLKRAGQNRLSTTWATEDASTANRVVDLLFQSEVGCDQALGGNNASEIVTAFSDAGGADFLLDCKSADDLCHVFSLNFTAVEVPADLGSRRRLLASSNANSNSNSNSKNYNAVVTQVAQNGVDGLLSVSAPADTTDPDVKEARKLKAGGKNAYKQYVKDKGWRSKWKDLDEEDKRYKRFSERLDLVETINTGDYGWKAGINEFADMLPEELASYTGAVPDSVPEDIISRRHLLDHVDHLAGAGRGLKQVASGYSWPTAATNASGFIPIYPDSVYPTSASGFTFKDSTSGYWHFNWEDKGIKTPVRNQGSCPSCWAHAAMAAVEYAAGIWGKLTGNKGLSVQRILQCAPSTYSVSCSAGNSPWRAFEIMKAAKTFDYDGLPTTSTSTTSTVPTTCGAPPSGYQVVNFDPTVKNASAVTVKFDTYLRYPTTQWALQEQILTKSLFHTPIGSEWIVGDDFYAYKSGVWTSSYNSATGQFNCEATSRGAHSMLIVGMGEQKNADGSVTPFWIVKNSWGTGFGQQNTGFGTPTVGGGYVLIRRTPTPEMSAVGRNPLKNTANDCGGVGGTGGAMGSSPPVFGPCHCGSMSMPLFFGPQSAAINNGATPDGRRMGRAAAYTYSWP